MSKYEGNKHHNISNDDFSDDEEYDKPDPTTSHNHHLTLLKGAEQFGIGYDELNSVTPNNNIFLYHNLHNHDKKGHLITMSRITAKLEDYAMYSTVMNKLLDDVDISFEQITELMNHYWNWHYPNDLIIYRALFYRHMLDYEVHQQYEITQGTCYSRGLFLVMMATSAKTLYGITSKLFTTLDSRGYELLVNDIKYNPNCLATIGGFIQLTLRAIDIDNPTMAWNFSGIAFRIARQLNLFNNSEETSASLLSSSLSVEELEARTILKNQLKIFDVLISLYLDRSLTSNNTDPQMTDEEVILDDSFDLVQWEGNTYKSQVGTPTTAAPDNDNTTDEDTTATTATLISSNLPTYLMETFKWKIQINLITNSIIKNYLQVFDITKIPLEDHHSKFSIMSLINQLRELWGNIPTILDANSKKFNPLPHTISLNLSYQLCYLLILLPMFYQIPLTSVEQRFLDLALETADNIKQCFELYIASFQIDLRYFIMTYTFYLYYQMLQTLSNLATVKDRIANHLEYSSKIFKSGLLLPAGGNAAINFVKNRQLRSSASASATTSNYTYNTLDNLPTPAPFAFAYHQNNHDPTAATRNPAAAPTTGTTTDTSSATANPWQFPPSDQYENPQPPPPPTNQYDSSQPPPPTSPWEDPYLM